MSQVWVLYHETNEENHEDSGMRVFSTFQEGKAAMQERLKQIASVKGLFFDGHGNLEHLQEINDIVRKMDPYYNDYWRRRYQVLCRTPDILRHCFTEGEMPVMDAAFLTNDPTFSGGPIIFTYDSKNGAVWSRNRETFYGFSSSRNDGKRDGEYIAEYCSAEIGTDPEDWFYARINAFRMDDPNEDYYCYLRAPDGYRDTGTFLHVELRKTELEGQTSMFQRLVSACRKRVAFFNKNTLFEKGKNKDQARGKT